MSPPSCTIVERKGFDMLRAMGTPSVPKTDHVLSPCRPERLAQQGHAMHPASTRGRSHNAIIRSAPSGRWPSSARNLNTRAGVGLVVLPPRLRSQTPSFRQFSERLHGRVHACKLHLHRAVASRGRLSRLLITRLSESPLGLAC